MRPCSEAGHLVAAKQDEANQMQEASGIVA